MRFLFKNPTKIYCLVWIKGDFTKELREGVKLDQDLIPNFHFYVTKTPDKYSYPSGFSLTEYSTGMCINGFHPEATANKAAAWLKLRVDNKGVQEITNLIKAMQLKYGIINR